MYLTAIALILCVSMSLPNFNTSLGAKLSHMSMIAYSSAAEISSWSCSTCCRDLQLQNIKVLNPVIGGIQAFAGYSPSDKAIILSFRGSENIQNWITDVQFLSVFYGKCEQCFVHSGFYIGINLVKEDMIQTLQQLRQLYNCNTIYLTGHSLGGALAVLAAAQIYDEMDQLKIGSLITFGCPRIGNRKFTKYIDSLVMNWRVVHYADIVTQLPPLDIFYRHEGYEVWYTKNMKKYQICKGDSVKCQRSLFLGQLREGDHAMSNYLKLQSSELKGQQCSLKSKTKKDKNKRKNRIGR